MPEQNNTEQARNNYNRSGDRLRLAREDRGWSIQETAEMLHVVPRYVTAIEKADYKQLPGLVFLKGYVRSYARLLELSEERIMEDLEQELLLSGDPILQQSPPSGSGFTEAKPPRARGWQVVLVLVLVAAGGFFAWQYYSQQSSGQGNPEPRRPDTPGIDESVEDEGEVAIADNAATTEEQPLFDPETGNLSLNFAEDDVVEADSQEQAGAVIEPLQTDEVSGLHTTVPESVTQPVENPEIDTGFGPEDVGEDAEPSATLIAAPLPDPPTTGQDASAGEGTELTAETTDISDAEAGQTELQPGTASVVASFTGDCWFDLRDKNNSRVVGLYRAGENLEFIGEYPLKFVVGAVNAVEIKINGESLDFGQYTVRNNRAQFVLE